MSDPVRRVAVIRPDGTLGLDETAVPPLEPGTVRIAVLASLVSPGTEVGGWSALARKYEARTEGSASGSARPFGYSVAGIVEEALLPEGASSLPAGMRVAAVGAGYALHSNTVVVPHNLCIPVPDGVAFEDACYAMLLATALHATRRGGPSIGESWGVFGLGLVGLLTARLLELSGCFVSGIDASEARVRFAERWLRAAHGPEQTRTVCATPERAESELAMPAVGPPSGRAVPDRARFDAGGLDGAVLAFGGEADGAINQAVRLMKRSPDGHPYGTIVTVGWPHFAYSDEIGAMNNIDLRRASRTGPGYHDDQWERGEDYPPVFMRWTTRTNLALSMELVRRGSVDVRGLTTHTIPLESVPEEMPRVLGDPDTVLGVVFTSRGDGR